MDIPGLIVLCGPTATGKTGLAIQIAQHLSTVILSADSRACYREFDIGTAKPSQTERQQVPHYLIDICDPRDTFTVATYQTQAQTLIAQLHQQGLVPLLVGGTGLYIQSITQGLKIPRVPPDAGLRSQLQSLGQHQLYELLQNVDPLSCHRIHPHDQVRTLRALEVYYVTGVTLSEQQGETPPAYPILFIGLDCLPMDALNQRIQKRTQKMIAAGFVTEVAMLCQKYGPTLPLLNTLGYRQIKQYLAGELTLVEAEALVVVHTRQFAKRQRTWFHTNTNIAWFNADDPTLFEQVYKRVQEFMIFPGLPQPP
ncbi:tRNA delta(2)-isopentenylpyrophosphate transferase [Neosynechococcus sphagnicola sy1]|uniref:tRNA dimethylallyltransferase n=1 Tax=Neosynechococcus sphagnicola sy1 TaxID=1497020 RepID=A0A098TMR2_9CYAN|nr:tRNA (adenosine(37)-N6)-dimethylallyltransferase MiaA [Neosynechococcus sphagnicola]KGF73610.1 tRNA delta(2)-isopentenylpyrophosphate transferase [Neosynechococcus sphagnicola sy1]